MQLNRTYKFKLTPTESQKKSLLETFKLYLFIKKGFVNINLHFYKNEGRFLTVKEMFSYIHKLNKKFPELKKLDNKYCEFCIVNVFNELKSYDFNIENNNKMNLYKIYIYNNFFIDHQKQLITIPTFSDIPFISSMVLKNIKSLFITYKNKDFYMYLNTTIESSVKKIDENKIIGIDVGLKEFAILSNNKKIPNPRFYRELEEKLSLEQKKLSKKEKGSSNYKKQLIKVNKIHNKIYNSRNNFLHQFTNYLTNTYDIIGIEKLKISKMVLNKQFSKSILDAGWGLFIKMLRYKALEKGKVVIAVDRFYPSSQICHNCKSKQIMPVHLRTFECASCKTKIDRDYNASLNIRDKALEIFYEKKGKNKKN